jgi:hypothetical protein
MKGVIADCLHRMVEEKYGAGKWYEIMKKTGMPEKSSFLASQDLEDAKVMEVINNACAVLAMSRLQMADAFGDYWVNTYAKKVYGIYYNRFANAKEFIMGMEAIHETTTKSIENAHPPKFEFKEIDDSTLLVTYKSKRNMIDFYIGLAKGVGTYFKTPIKLEKLSESQVKMTFSE